MKTFLPNLKRCWLWLFAALLLVTISIPRCHAESAKTDISLDKPRTLLVRPEKFSEINEVSDFAWSPDSKMIAINCGIYFRIVSVPSWKVVRKISLNPEEERSSFQFTPDSKSIRFLGPILSDNQRYPNKPDAPDEFVLPTGRFKRGNWQRAFSPNDEWGRISTNTVGDGVTRNGKTKIKIEMKEYEYPHAEDNGTYLVTYGLGLQDKNGKLLHSLWKGKFKGRILRTQFVSNGKLFFAALPEGEDLLPERLHGWQVEDGKEIISFPMPYGDVEVTPDGKTAVIFKSFQWGNLEPRSIALYNLQTQKLIQTIQNPDDTCAAQFSPDGTMLAVGGEDGTLTLWRVK